MTALIYIDQSSQSLAKIGQIRAEQGFIARGLNGKIIIETNIYALKSAWQRTLKGIG